MTRHSMRGYAVAFCVGVAIALAVMIPSARLIGFASGRRDAPGASANSVHVIRPYNVQGIWAFDDQDRGLVREPFVGAINPMIDRLVTNVPNARIGFRLLFSAGFIPDYHVKLVWRRREGSGNWYYCEEYKTEGWLCPSLLKYFPAPPKEIYARADPLPAELMDLWKKKHEKYRW